VDAGHFACKMCWLFPKVFTPFWNYGRNLEFVLCQDFGDAKQTDTFLPVCVSVKLVDEFSQISGN